MVEVVRADPGDPQLAAFVAAHLADIAPTAPQESRHALPVEGLRAAGVRVWVARSGARVVGMTALAPAGEATEELKSMRTDPSLRRRGVATNLLSAALQDAADRGVREVVLETGSMAFFTAARALYARFGFLPCGPFGRYVEDPNSVFMRLRLTGQGRPAPTVRGAGPPGR